MRKAPTYTWRLKDHRLNRTLEEGEAPSIDKAKAAFNTAVRRAGGWRNGMAGGVNRPSGGGWFARAPVGPHSPITWEEWEPVVL